MENGEEILIQQAQQGDTIHQAAEGMQCSEGAVKSYLFRARRKLQILLRPFWEEK